MGVVYGSSMSSMSVIDGYSVVDGYKRYSD